MRVLPEEARHFFDAVAAKSADAVAQAFTPHGVVVDVDRRIVGREAILRWAADEVIGASYDVLDVTPRADGVAILLRFTRPGENQGFRALYRLTFSAGAISLADLQYA